MQHRSAKPNAFQSELSGALQKRKEAKGLPLHSDQETESDEDDDYEDDFDEDDLIIQHGTLKSSTKPQRPSRRQDDWDLHLPSYLKDDEDDILGGGGSMFYKEQEKKKITKAPFDPLGMGNREQTQKQAAILEEDSESDDYEDDPILKLLRDDKPKKEKEKLPTPVKRSNKAKDHGKAPKSPLSRSLSPGLEQQRRTKSPDGGIMSPKARKSPTRGSLEQSMHRSTEMSRRSPDSSKYITERHKADRHISSESRPKTPLSGRQSPDFKDILQTIKSKETPEVFSTEPQSRTAKKDFDQSQSFVDFLLDPSQPKPAPRKKGSKPSSVDSESRKSTINRSLSPTTSQREDKKDDLRKRRTLSGERGQNKEPSPNRPLSPRNEKQLYSTMPLPSIQPGEKSPTGHSDLGNKERTMPRSTLPPPFGKSGEKSPTGHGDLGNKERTMPRSTRSPTFGKSEREKSKSDADDLLALFNQAVKDEPVDFQAHIQQKQQEKMLKTPLEEVVHKTAEQKTQLSPSQRSSRQLFDNVIENVAKHNDGSESSTSTLSEHGRKTPLSKSGKKSYRTPPAGYQGLGSLTMLKELKKADKTSDEMKDEDVSTDEIRKRIYLEWLAKREEEAKKKKKEETEKKKGEEEEIMKKRREREEETFIVRRKWEEKQLERDKEKAKLRRAEAKKEKEKQEKKDKQKAKSAKDADKRRQNMRESAKISHRAELRKKHEENKNKKEEEEKQKKENKKAVEKWMEERSEKWVVDRKKEQKEKHFQQIHEKKEKDRAAKKADENYNTWREQKDNQLKNTMRENRIKQTRQNLNIDEDDDNFRPPWSPANKVIPRRR